VGTGRLRSGASAVLPVKSLGRSMFARVRWSRSRMVDDMITGKDLMDWGMKPGPIFKTALKVLAESKKGWGKPQVEVSFKQMLAEPELFIRHELLAPIAQVMIVENKKVVEKKGTEMNAKGCPITIFGEELIEPGAIRQIHVAAKLPISVQAACMPDAHEGYGLPIGGVLATDGAVIPYAVGVDIGCRMQMSIFDFPGCLAKGQRGRLENILMEQTVFGKGVDIDCKVTHPVLEHEDFNMGRVKGLRLRERAVKQIGTSGGGNHFVEFGIFEHPDLKEPKLAVLSHSGSRGVGFAIANLYTKIAMEKRRLPGDAKHLAWLLLTEDEGIEYWRAMELAGDFAKACHYVIHHRIERALGEKRLMTFENHHNFAWKERLDGRDVIVHRKGATPAGKGVPGLIPGSMTTPTYLVVGKGNEASMSSSSHGAGRAMSRKEAKERYTMSQLRQNLEAAGVTLIGGSVDECSMAYKSITDVMEAQKDLVEIRGVFKPFVVRMAGEETKPWEAE
jgi:tRNA-splicing ligase RtcB